MRMKAALLGSLVALLLGACSGSGGGGGGGYGYGTAPTTAPSSEAFVTVSDQDARAGQVRVDEIETSGPSWIVIHTQANGGPGPVIGYAAVPDGRSTDVVVDVDASAATPVLYAMLHTDAGTVGTYEFPGADVPVAGERTNVPFNVTLAAQEPQVSVSDQTIVDGTLTIDRVVATEPGWIVIHSESNGGPGPIVGYAPVSAGVNPDVSVAIDVTAATPSLYAMVHVDAGAPGTYEFPGADAPVAGDQTNPRFNLQVSEGPTVDVDMRSFSFSPRSIVVRAGTTVRWTNFDAASHSTTSDEGLWDSGLFGPEENFSFAFETPGVYLYHCTAHGGPGGAAMSGQVTVIP